MVAIDTALLDEVVTLARAAGELTLRWYREEALAVEHKGDGTPVTAADKAAERFLREELGRRFPDDAVIGEEESYVGGHQRSNLGDRSRSTAPSRSRTAYRSTAIWSPSTTSSGAQSVSSTCPPCARSSTPGADSAAFPNGRPTQVNDTTSLDGACVCTSGLGGWTAAQLDALRDAGPLIRTWGDGFGFALVATGRIEAMVDPKVAVWDLGPLPVDHPRSRWPLHGVGRTPRASPSTSTASRRPWRATARFTTSCSRCCRRPD